MRFSEGESEKQNKIGEVNNNNEHTRTSLENKNLIKIKVKVWGKYFFTKFIILEDK